MSTLNVGAMAARLGLDPSDFLEKMKGVQGVNAFATGEMKRQWKESSREGAESLRLIDESLGIHISRPLVRILTQELPGLAKGLQAVLGVGVVGALGTAAFEFAEGISRKMDEAKKKQEEYQDAVRKTKNVIADAAIESEKQLDSILAKTSALAGDSASAERYKAMEAYAESVQKTATFVNALTEAERKEAAAAAAQMTWWAAFGKIWHELWNTNATLGVEKIADEIKVFQDKFDDLSKADALKGTHTAAKYLTDQLTEAQNKQTEMIAAQAKAEASVYVTAGPHGSQVVHHDLQGPSNEELDANQARIDALKEIQEQARRNGKLGGAQGNLDDLEASIEGLRKIRTEQERNAEEARSLGKALHEALDKTDDISRLDDEFKKQMIDVTRYRDLVGGKAFFAEFGLSADDLRQKLAAITGELESQAQLKRFFDETKETRGNAKTLPSFAFTPATPTLANSGAVDAQLAAFGEEPRKQLELMKKAYEDGLTPLQKFEIAQRELDLILKDANGNFIAGSEGAAAYAGAMRHVVEEEEKQLAASLKATDGVHAFWLEMQIEAGKNGTFAFDLLNKAVKGFEDNLANAIVDGTRNWKREWESLAKDLEKTTLKFAFTKTISGVGGEIGKTGFGKRLGGLFGAGKNDAGETANNAALATNTTAVNANTAAITAGSARTAAGALTGPANAAADSGSGGAGLFSLFSGGFSGFFAEGGDATPGSSFISGEAGAEKVDLDGAGGAHITPLGMKSGGDTHYHNYDLRGAVVTDDLMRKADAARMMSLSEQRTIQSSASMQREISLRKRPG